MNMEGSGAYGAGKATGHFDCSAYVRKPQVILRAVSLVFSAIVFSCMLSSGEQEHCSDYNKSECDYGINVSVIAFLGITVFLVLDALFDNISSVKRRLHIVIADIAFSGVRTVMWFAFFCTVANGLDDPNQPVKWATAFSSFSVVTFAGSTFLAVRNYRKGVGDDFFIPNYEPPVTPVTSSILVPGVNEDRFLPTPFSGADISKGGSKVKNDPPQGHSDAPRNDSGAPPRNGDAPQESGSGAY